MGIRERLANLGRRAATLATSAADYLAPATADGLGAEPSEPEIVAGHRAPFSGSPLPDDPSLYGAAPGEVNSLTHAIQQSSWAPGLEGVRDSISEIHGVGREGVAKAATATATPAARNPLSDLDEPKGVYWDPYGLVQQLGFRDKPSALTFDTLRSMVWRVPIIHDIIQTRVTQVSAFATPQHYRFETGFSIVLRDREAKPTPADKKESRRITDALMHGGTNGPVLGQYSIETVLRMLTRDTLSYDQVGIEVIRDRRGKPAQWFVTDATTLRLADTGKLYPELDPNAIHVVQLFDNVIVGEYTREEMAFEVRNPRSDIRNFGYGTPETEMLVTIITALLYAFDYNKNFFSQGSVAKGLLNLVGALPETQLRSFRRQWHQMVSGTANAFRTPITNVEKIEWINMMASNKDMEYSAWFDFLIKVCCACFTMDPIEINFKYGTQASRSMFEGAQRAKAQESRERGLRPLLRFLARVLNRYIVRPINDDFELQFVGLESQTPKEMADLMTQRVRTIYTIDEVRAENDLEPLPDGLGKIILDANWINARNQLIQQQREEEQQAEQQKMAEMQQYQAQQPGMAGGVEHLDQILSQLEAKEKQQTKKEAKNAPKPTSTPAQTPKDIQSEMRGVSVEGEGMEASLRGSDMMKAQQTVIVEVEL